MLELQMLLKLVKTILDSLKNKAVAEADQIAKDYGLISCWEAEKRGLVLSDKDLETLLRLDLRSRRVSKLV